MMPVFAGIPILGVNYGGAENRAPPGCGGLQAASLPGVGWKDGNGMVMVAYRETESGLRSSPDSEIGLLGLFSVGQSRRVKRLRRVRVRLY